MRRLLRCALAVFTLNAVGIGITSEAHAAPSKGSGTSSGTTTKGKKGRMTAPLTYSVATASAHAQDAEPVWATAFRIYSTYDVFFAIDLPASATGRHTVALEARMPNGMVYQRWEVVFATDNAAAPGELQAEVTSTGWRVWVSLPVAGTMIQHSNLVGVWTSDAFLDGAPYAGATSKFTLY